MTFSRRLLTCLALSAATTMAFAAAPAKKPAPTTPLPMAKTASTNAPAATPPLPAPAPTPVTLDDYMKELKSELNLSASEEQEIQSYYTADGAQIQTILNDDTLSPLQKYQQVSDLRDTRNGKILGLLNDLNRQQDFLKIEAKYRVTLTLLAANGQLVAAAPPPAK